MSASLPEFRLRAHGLVVTLARCRAGYTPSPAQWVEDPQWVNGGQKRKKKKKKRCQHLLEAGLGDAPSFGAEWACRCLSPVPGRASPPEASQQVQNWLQASWPQAETRQWAPFCRSPSGEERG